MSDPAKVAEGIEVILERALEALEGVDDEDRTQPRLILEQLAEAAREGHALVLPITDEDDMSAAEMRGRIRAGRAKLARRNPVTPA